MRLEEELALRFKEHGWTWHLKESRDVVPEVYDIELALDEAAKMLYNETVGTQLEVGRLIIKKQPRGHDVYLYTGTYE